MRTYTLGFKTDPIDIWIGLNNLNMLSRLYRRPQQNLSLPKFKIMSTKKAPLKTTLYSIPVLLAMLLIPRVNENSLKISNKKIENKMETVIGQYVDLTFPVLKITKEEIIDLFEQNTGEPKVHKVVFKFNIDDKAATLDPSLTAFRAQRNDRKYINAEVFKTLERTAISCAIPGEYSLGNLELRRKVRGNSTDISWEKILKKAAETDTHLYFYPRKEGTSVTYVLAWGRDTPKTCEDANKINFVENGLNPSPPADPK